MTRSSDTLSFGRAFKLTLLTDDPDLAVAADAAGIDRVGVDIEQLGKAERQRSREGARISGHTFDDLHRLRGRVRRGRLFCRLDPPHARTREQVAEALASGASSLMLPYFTGVDEARAFVEAVAGRAETLLLVETRSAFSQITALAALEGVDEIMIGLNDLSWDLGHESRFDLLTSPAMKAAAGALASAGRRFGLGGLARWDDHRLPVSPDLICAQYPRLGARSAWLARSFLDGVAADGLAAPVESLRARLDHWSRQQDRALEAARQELEEMIVAAPPR